MRYYQLLNPDTLEIFISVELETQPENSLPFELVNFHKPCFNQYPNPTEIVEGATEQDLEDKMRNSIPLIEFYSIEDYRNVQLDNLNGIVRKSTLADKGLKGEKKYYKDDVLVWSSEKKYWFQEDGYEPGFKRIIRVFNRLEEVVDTWEVFYELSADDKQFFLEEQRRMIFHYFKSQQPELFNLLYTFFKDEIDLYVVKGGSALADTLTDASTNHPVELVRNTLSMEIPTQSGGVVTVLQGIFAELV
jgi:hypothetical protein